jgi:hypothetical protein
MASGARSIAAAGVDLKMFCGTYPSAYTTVSIRPRPYEGVQQTNRQQATGCYNTDCSKIAALRASFNSPFLQHTLCRRSGREVRRCVTDTRRGLDDTNQGHISRGLEDEPCRPATLGCGVLV